MPRDLFISYRREDQPHAVDRLRERLADRFGSERIFHDIDGIPLGSDFRTVVDEVLARCSIVLVVMGRGWYGGESKRSQRIGRENDWPRIEVEVALGRGVSIIPVWVDDFELEAERLPDSIKPLAFRHAARLRSGLDFDADCARLIEALEKLLPGGYSSDGWRAWGLHGIEVAADDRRLNDGDVV